MRIVWLLAAVFTGARRLAVGEIASYTALLDVHGLREVYRNYAATSSHLGRRKYGNRTGRSIKCLWSLSHYLQAHPQLTTSPTTSQHSTPTSTMLSSIITFPIALFAALAAAAPAAFEARQPGGVFVSVGNKYAGPGCTPQTLIFADPIFGRGNACQPLDRFSDGAPIVSYTTLSISQGCSGKQKSSPRKRREQLR
jgi:hypothetical protein